jgi:hypothetical protein
MKTVFFCFLLLMLGCPLFAEILVENTRAVAHIEGEALHFELQISFRKIGNHGESLEVLPKNVQILNQSGAAILKRQETGFHFYLKDPGTSISTVTARLLLQKDQENPSFFLPYFVGTVASFTLTLPEAHREVLLDGDSFLLSQRSFEDRTEVEIAPSRQLLVKWRKAEIQETLQPLYSSQCQTHISFLEGEVHSRVNLEIQMIRGSIESLALQIPADQKVLQLRGSFLKTWKIEQNILTLYFQQALTTSTTFSLVLSQIYGETLPTQVSLEPLKCQGASRQNGAFLFEKASLSLKEVFVQDMAREDIERLETNETELTRAYQFRGNAPKLTLEIKKLPPELRLELHTLFYDEGSDSIQFLSYAHFFVEQAPVETLSLLLPPSLQLFYLKERIETPKLNRLIEARLSNWVQEGDKITLHLKGAQKGKLSFVLEGQLKTYSWENLPQIQVPPPLHKLSGTVGISAPPLKLFIEKAEEITRINTSELPLELRKASPPPQIGFSFGDKPYQLQLKTVPLKPYLISSTQTRYHVLPENIHFQAEYQLVSKDIGLFSLDFPLPEGLEITDVKAPQFLDTWKILGNTLHIKFTKEMKESTLSLQGIFSSELQKKLTLLSPSQAQEVKGELEFEVDPEIQVTLQEIQQLEELPYEKTKKEGTYKRFKILEASASLKYSAEILEPEIHAKLFTLSTFVRGYVVVQSEMVLNIQKAGVRKLSMKLPSKAGNLIITGDAVLDFYPRENDYQIELKQKYRGPLTLWINYDIPFKIFGTSSLALEGLDLLSAKEVEGFEGWQKSEIPIEIALDAFKGYEKSTFQKPPRTSPSGKIKLTPDSFIIKERNRDFSVNIKGLKQTEIQEVHISDLHIRTQVNDEGKLTTHLHCNFSNSTRQFLRIKVDPKATLWGTYVSEIHDEKTKEAPQAVKPTLGKEGEILVPLPKNVKKGAMEMVFIDQVQKMGFFGDLELISPTIEEVQVDKVNWDLVIPKDLLLVRHEGPFELKPVSPVLLPDSLAFYLQNEILQALKKYLPAILWKAFQGFNVLFVLIGFFSFFCLVYCFYLYYGPDQFLHILLRTVLFLGIAFTLYLVYKVKPLYCGIVIGCTVLGAMLYASRRTLLDQILLLERPQISSSWFWLILIVLAIFTLGYIALPGTRSPLRSRSDTSKYARSFTEMSATSAYDSSAQSAKHRTGKMEGDDDDSWSGRYNDAPSASSEGSYGGRFAPQKFQDLESPALESEPAKMPTAPTTIAPRQQNALEKKQSPKTTGKLARRSESPKLKEEEKSRLSQDELGMEVTEGSEEDYNAHSENTDFEETPPPQDPAGPVPEESSVDEISDSRGKSDRMAGNKNLKKLRERGDQKPGADAFGGKDKVGKNESTKGAGFPVNDGLIEEQESDPAQLQQEQEYLKFLNQEF